MRWYKGFIISAVLGLCTAFGGENLEILKALQAVQNSDFKQAIEIYTKLYKEKNDKAYLKQAIEIALFSQSKDIDKILSIGDRVLGNDSNFLSIKAFNYMQKNDLVNAKKAILKSIKIKSEAKNHSLFGSILLLSNDLQGAKTQFEKAYELEKNEDDLMRLFDFLYTDFGKKDDAMALLQTHKRINGCTKIVCTTLAKAYEKDRKFDELAQIYAELYELENDTLYLDSQIRIYVWLKKFDDAINAASKYEDDKKLEVLFEIYVEKGDFDMAIDSAKKLYEDTKNPKFKALSAIYRYEKFGSNISKEELKKVIDDFEISAINTDDDMILNYYGYLLIDHDLDIQKGIELVKLALKKQPKSAHYLDSLAWGYYKIKDCDLAKIYMDEAFEDSEFTATLEAKEHKEKINKCVSEKR